MISYQGIDFLRSFSDGGGRGRMVSDEKRTELTPRLRVGSLIADGLQEESIILFVNT